jgi:hypothetical protein
MTWISDRKSINSDVDVFKTIFNDHWGSFIEAHPQYNIDQYNDPVQKMLGCKDASNGYSEYICMHCGRDRIRIPFSCKSCFCLSCSRQYVDNFVSQVSVMLHTGVIYRHIVLTLPEQLRPMFFKERFSKDLLSGFMKCGSECLEDVVSTVKRKTLKIGTIVVVQTHGRSGRYNPHLHIIMTSGGICAERERWYDLGYFKYEIIHKKWQYHLFTWLKGYFDSSEVNRLVDMLWKEYPNGLVANVSKGSVPDACRGLAGYLAKYVASPPIAVRRIVSYDGETVGYWYKDHKTKSKKFEKVPVYTFIGRMVQHIMPKGFQRVRYYGLEATKTYKKWSEVIQKGIKRIGRIVKGAYQIVKRKKYRERYQEISGIDPMICQYCEAEMELMEIWHPKYGVLYDIFSTLEEVKDEQKKIDRGGGYSVWPPAGGVQLPLFTMSS